MNDRPPILVVDDEEEARSLIKILLEKAAVTNPIKLFASGEEAIEYLKDRYLSAAAGLLKCGLMLLDVKMPRLSGFDVLGWIRQQELLNRLIVVMFSTSDEAKDIERAMKLGAHTYLLKFPSAM